MGVEPHEPPEKKKLGIATMTVYVQYIKNIDVYMSTSPNFFIAMLGHNLQMFFLKKSKSLKTSTSSTNDFRTYSINKWAFHYLPRSGNSQIHPKPNAPSSSTASTICLWALSTTLKHGQ